MNRTVGSRGFTLLEMLVSIAIMGVLSWSLYASLSIGFNAKHGSERVLSVLRAADASFDIINRDIKCAMPPRGILAGPFIGEVDYMSFFTRPVQTLWTAPSIAEVSYFLSEGPDGEGGVLTRSVRFNLLSMEESEPFLETISFNVESFEISYYDGAAWFDSWDSTAVGDLLPAAVRVSIVMNRVGERHGSNGFFSRVFIPSCAVSVQTEIASGAT